MRNNNKARVRPGRRGFVGWGKPFPAAKATEAHALATSLGAGVASTGEFRNGSYRMTHMFVLASKPGFPSEGWEPIVVTGRGVVPVTISGALIAHRIVTGPQVHALVMHTEGRGDLPPVLELTEVTALEKKSLSAWAEGREGLLSYFWAPQSRLAQE